MNEEKSLVFVIVGAALMTSGAEEAHHSAQVLETTTVRVPVAEPLQLCCLPHGNEPEQPGGPLLTPWVVATSGTSMPAISKLGRGLAPLTWPSS